MTSARAKILIGLWALVVWVSPASGQPADTLQFYSEALQRTQRAVVFYPEGSGPFPVLYVLHGHGGSYRNWPDRTDLAHLANTFNLILVSPDGGRDGWYVDSPVQDSARYATHVGVEVPRAVLAHAGSRADSLRQGLVGLSMGGHGAVSLALDFPHRFKAAASLSGGLDLLPFPERWGLSARLGPLESVQDSARWAQFSLLQRVRHLDVEAVPALWIDCGVDDFFIQANREMRAELLARGIPHTYIERPGAHTWTYWVHALPDALRFLAISLQNAPTR